MSVDVEMMALTAEPLSDEDFDVLRSAFRLEFGEDWHTEGPNGPAIYPDLVRATWGDLPDRLPRLIEVDTLASYYGPGYERGDWPAIKRMGDWLMVRLGETAEVRYGGDTADGWDALLPWLDERERCDEHYAKFGHLPYWERHGGCDCDQCRTLRGR